MTTDIIEQSGDTPAWRSTSAVRPAEQQYQVAPATPADMIMYAMKAGAPMEQIRELIALKREVEADEARKAFVADMAEFKKNPPTIVKDKAVGYTNKDGSFTGYKHASLGNVTNAIVEGLARNGFSHRWDLSQTGAVSKVTCTITHRMGHSESVTMEAAKDDSGKKNAIQQVASAVSYLQRYTLLMATGLATHDQDDDGAGTNVGTTDTTLADKWLAKVAAAKTDADVVKVWEDGVGPIENSGDTHAYDEFKDAISSRRTALAQQAKSTKPAKAGA